MTEAANTRRTDLATRWHGLDAALPALTLVREKLETAGYEDEAETAAAFLAEMSCEFDAVEKLLVASVESDGDGCEVCGAFSHASGECQENEEKGRKND